MRWKLTAWILAMAVIAGCGGENPLERGKKRRGPGTQLGGQLAPAVPPPPPAPTETPSEEQPQDAVAQPAPSPPAPPKSDTSVKPDPNAVLDQATPGVTGRGQGYGPGPITTPIATYFRVQERVVFDIEITSAMKMYKALNGHFPKTHEEFMEKIINESSIRLPKLNPGENYIYDAEKAAKIKNYDPKDPPLMVERTR